MSFQTASLALTAFLAYRALSVTPCKSIQGNTILITGAAGGLGRALCESAAKRGAGTLVLWDLDQAGLDALAKELRANYPKVKSVVTQVVNLADKKSIHAEAAKTIASVGVPDILVNNAGIVMGKYLCEVTDEQDELTFAVNSLAPIILTKIFLPLFEKRGSGHVVVVSSFAAYVAASGMVTYAASKFASRGFAEGLVSELSQRDSPVKVTCVCPSHFTTPLFSGFAVTGNLEMTPEYVADKLFEGVEAERQLVCLPLYLLWSMPWMALWQVGGRANIPNFMKENAMQNWKGAGHAGGVFQKMAKL